MRRHLSDKAESSIGRAPLTTARALNENDRLWREVGVALSMDEDNPALRDPRFLRWLAEHDTPSGTDASFSDEQWIARGQALRDAARRLEVRMVGARS